MFLNFAGGTQSTTKADDSMNVATSSHAGLTNGTNGVNGVEETAPPRQHPTSMVTSTPAKPIEVIVDNHLSSPTSDTSADFSDSMYYCTCREV